MAHDRFADVVAREIPAPFIGRFLEAFHNVKLANANGNGCGNACGNSCIDGVGFTFDRYGHAGLSHAELEAAQKDLRTVRSAIDGAVTRALK